MHKVKQGDCIPSIAEKHGIKWETIWDHPENATLKEKRQNPNILCPGDLIFIPEMEKKYEDVETEQTHTFQKNSGQVKLFLHLVINDESLINHDYELIIDGTFFSGTTDNEGMLECLIPANAKEGKLQTNIYNEITEKEETETFILELGNLDPIDTIKGLQGRLKNLGFYSDKIDGVLTETTISAIRSFQRKHELDDTVKITSEKDGKTSIITFEESPAKQTIDKLHDKHGC